MHASIIDPVAIPNQSPNFQLTVKTNVTTQARFQQRIFGNRLVSHFRVGDIEAFCLGRLYYTDELANRYRVRDSIVGREAEFISKLVASGGHNVIKEIEGEFALALIDHASGAIMACRDAFGGYPLYFYQDDYQVVLGTNAHGISHQTGKATLSNEYLGRFLSLPMAIYSETLQGSSPFDEIYSVMPGQLVQWNVATGKRMTKMVQGFADAKVDEDAYRSAADFQAAVYQAVVDSVNQRAVGNVCCHSSSGMDSTVVATVANQLHDRGAIAGGCHAITMVYEKDRSLRGENEFIDIVHRRLTMTTHRINGDTCINYSPLMAGVLYQHAEPNAFLTRMPIHSALTGKANELGADTILTGAGGDHLFENHPTVLLADDLLGRRLLSAFRRSSIQSRSTGASRMQSVRSAINTVRWHAPTFGRMRMPQTRPWNLQSEFEIADWYDPHFVRDSLIAAQMQSGLSSEPGRTIPLDWYYKAIYAPAMGDQMRWTLAAPLGIHIAHPYFDRRLCSLVLNAPLELRYGFDRDKGLSAAIFKRELPPELIARKSKIGLRDLMTRGFSEHRDRLQTMVKMAPDSLDRIVDRNKLLSALRLASLGVFQSAIALDRLNLILALTHWLTAKDGEESDYFVHC
ncbi:MAG: asparagine synthase-related protein [Pirellula sp.]